MVNPFQQARLSRDPRFDGLFFVAVISTGIFCRPICPARLPAEANVRYFRAAHQASEAGYRPCLRCRPDSAPGSWAWLGSQTTLQRAISLIQQHPGVRVSALCAKLGISERYLHKLFSQHLGIAPKAFILTEQLLQAKRLLQQTPLGITEVAINCGFNSARSLQHHMQKRWSLAPGALRQSNACQQTLELKLAYRPPYNWAHMRQFLALRQVTAMERVDDSSYSRTFTHQDATGWMRVSHEPADHRLALSLRLSDHRYLSTVIHRIRRMFDLDAEPSTINLALKRAGLNHAVGDSGLRIPGIWSPFEAGCRAILGQQVSVKASIRLLTTLVAQLGEEHATGERLFPSPQSVAASDLSFLKLPGARRDSLRRLAEHLATEPEASPAQWVALKGIGPWTVDYVRMRQQGAPDIWLGGDLIIKKQITRMDLSPDEAAPWRSYLTLALWSLPCP